MATSWDEIKAGIFAGESGGDYNALFGFSNRPGGQFSNVRVTDMTVDEAINFANPRGPYAQWVKNKIGRVATPMGGFQVVGDTMKQAKHWAGLAGNERLTPDIQDRLGQAILRNQGTGAWEGYRGPRKPKVNTNPNERLGGDSLVARNFAPEVAAQTSTPLFGSMSPGGGGGGSPRVGAPEAGAIWGLAEDKPKQPSFGDRLSAAGKALSGAVMPPAQISGGGADARSGVTPLLKLLENPQALAQLFMQRRMG